MFVLGQVSEILKGAPLVRDHSILLKFFGPFEVDAGEILFTRQISNTLRRHSQNKSPNYLFLKDAIGFLE